MDFNKATKIAYDYLSVVDEVSEFKSEFNHDEWMSWINGGMTQDFLLLLMYMAVARTKEISTLNSSSDDFLKKANLLKGEIGAIEKIFDELNRLSKKTEKEEQDGI